MSTLASNLIELLSAHGMKASIIDYGHSVELVKEIEDRHDFGGLTDEIYNRYLTRYKKNYNENSRHRSVIVVAAPQMPGILEFTYNGRVYPVTIPPTYVYGDLDAIVTRLVNGYLEPLGYRIERSALPNKLLAVRSGLGSYGKNNVCYVPELGSFHRIVSFYTDMPCENDSWQEAKVMERCSSCKICMKNCCTGCIQEDRFLIHAENCLTHLNENGGEFPEWLDPKAHNAIVGCMDCQSACPENRSKMKAAEVLESFDSEETSTILGGASFDGLTPALKAKLERLTLAEYWDVLPRNLRVLIEK